MNSLQVYELRICFSADILQTCDKVSADDEAACEYSAEECSSPLHVTPLFRTLAAAIPSPKFSESVSSLDFYDQYDNGLDTNKTNSSATNY